MVEWNRLRAGDAGTAVVERWRGFQELKMTDLPGVITIESAAGIEFGTRIHRAYYTEVSSVLQEASMGVAVE